MRAFRSQCRWINEHRRQLNIAFVLHVGDVVDDYSDDAQWKRAESALDTLSVPHILAAGNHDLIDYPRHQPSVYCGTGQYDRFFPLQRFERMPTFHSAFTSSGANSSHVFVAEGVKFLVLTLEFGPSDEQLLWAGRALAAHPDHVGVLVTHDYLGDDDQLRGARTRGPERDLNDFLEEFALPGGARGTRMGWANTGVQIWDKLVRGHSNLRIVVNGHVCTHEARMTAPGGWRTVSGSPYAPSIAGRRTTFRDDGSAVYEFLSNYQSMPQGGLGYLRIIEIDPAQGCMKVSTYSPYLNQYLKNPDDEFRIDGVDFARTHEHAVVVGAQSARPPYLNDLLRLASLGVISEVPRMLSHPDECLTTQEMCLLTPALTRHVFVGRPADRGQPSAPPAERARDHAGHGAALVSRAGLARYCVDLIRRAGTPKHVRAEFLDTVVDFDDMPAAHEDRDSIKLLRGLGVLAGWPDNTVRLHEPLTRGNAATILSRALTACGR